MTGRWTVTINWIETVFDGKDEHRYGRPILVAGPPAFYDTLAQAEAAAARIRANRQPGSTVEVSVDGPPDLRQHHLSDDVRSAGLESVKAMRQAMRGDEPDDKDPTR